MKTTIETSQLEKDKKIFLAMLVEHFVKGNGDWPNKIEILTMASLWHTDMLITMDDINKFFDN